MRFLKYPPRLWKRQRRAKYWIARATCEDGLGQRDMAVALFDQGAKMTMGDEKNAVYEALMAFVRSNARNVDLDSSNSTGTSTDGEADTTGEEVRETSVMQSNGTDDNDNRSGVSEGVQFFESSENLFSDTEVSLDADSSSQHDEGGTMENDMPVLLLCSPARTTLVEIKREDVSSDGCKVPSCSPPESPSTRRRPRSMSPTTVNRQHRCAPPLSAWPQ